MTSYDFQSRHINTRKKPGRMSVLMQNKHVHQVLDFLVRIFQIDLSKGLKGLINTAVRMGIFLFGLGILFLLFLYITLPDIENPRNLLASQSTVITDREGVELYRLFQEEDRTYIDGSRIPQYAKQAIIAIEDERFYTRGCLDIRAIARVIFLLGQQGGGSTITRQLARNALDLQKENRYIRKVKELILGCQLESQYSKEELIDLYLNWIPFGQNAYGIEQASHVYFGKSASGLTLAESSVLAALPQRPSYFSPYGSHVRTKVTPAIEEQVLDGSITKVSQIDDDDIEIGLLGTNIGTGSITLYIGGRTDQVLRNMQNGEFITEQQRLAALSELEGMKFQPSRESIRAPHFVLWIREQMEEIFGSSAEEGLFEQGGLTVETTLDWDLQQAAEDVIAFHREDIANRFGADNIALLSVDPASREILAYVGNADYSDEEHGGKIDMVHVPRQPGSSFKPLVYAAAFEQGYSPATVLYDVPTKIGDDEPQNFDLKFMGPITIRAALGASRNIPAAKAFFLAGGEEKILSLVARMGAPSPLVRRNELAQERPDGFDYGWPLALGAAETSLYEMAQAYTTFAAQGAYKPFVSIRRITDKKGNILYESQVQEEEQAIDPRIAYQITSILSDESARPSEFWRTQLTIPGYQTAAKTGTSNKCLEFAPDGDCRLIKPDNGWVLGYTPNLFTGVWIGNADSSALFDKGDGLNTASPVWRDYMMRAHRKLENPIATFTEPDGIIKTLISTLSSELPTECTPVQHRKADIFLEERPPTKPDPACAQLTIDQVTHLLASDTCPAEARASGSFLIAHSILPDRWPTWEEGVQAWVTKQMDLWYATENHSGAIIPLPVAPTEYCDPALTPGRLTKPTLSIVFPREGGVASHPSFKPQITYSSEATVREVHYKIDDRNVKTVTESPFEQPLRVPGSLRKDGNHTLTVTLIDEYYNEVSAKVLFRFDEDTTLPSIRILQPSDGAHVKNGDSLTILADAEDLDGGIKYVQFYLGDTLLTTKPQAPYELSYKIDLPDGTYTVRAVAQDIAENTGEDSVQIVVGEGGAAPSVFGDKPVLLAPTQESLSLAVNAVVDVSVELPTLGTADLRSVEALIRSEETAQEDSLLKLSEGSGTYKRQWKAKKPGSFTLILRSVDSGGTEKVWNEVEIIVQ